MSSSTGPVDYDRVATHQGNHFSRSGKAQEKLQILENLGAKLHFKMSRMKLRRNSRKLKIIQQDRIVHDAEWCDSIVKEK